MPVIAAFKKLGKANHDFEAKQDSTEFKTS